MPRIRLHDLQHAHALLWLMAGGSIAEVQRKPWALDAGVDDETYGHIAEDHRVRRGQAAAHAGSPEVRGGATRMTTTAQAKRAGRLQRAGRRRRARNMAILSTPGLAPGPMAAR